MSTAVDMIGPKRRGTVPIRSPARFLEPFIAGRQRGYGGVRYPLRNRENERPYFFSIGILIPFFLAQATASG
jgi:hypothetical protein